MTDRLSDAGLGLVESILPPHSVEAEQTVLGAILFNPMAMEQVVEILKPAHFYRSPHMHIYQGMCDLYELMEPIDFLTLSERLVDTEKLDAAGGRAYIQELGLSVSTSDNALYYAKIIVNKAILRQLVNAGQEIAQNCMQPINAEEAIDRSQQLIFEIAQHGIQNDARSLKSIAPETMASIRHRQENQGRLMGLSTGFYDLDNYTCGLQKSDLVILAARPSAGKTALCLNIAVNAARIEKRHVLIFSLEMDEEMLATRMLCSEAQVDAQRVRNGTLTEYDYPKLMAVMGEEFINRIHIADASSVSVMEMRAKARKLQQQLGEPLGLIVVDYLQLMDSRGGNEENRTQEISKISRGLKSLAREMKVPVLALSQLSRAVESRQDKRPMLSDLRESGAIEQDADLVMFIYRDDYYNKDSERPGMADIIIAKQRNGPVGEVELLFRHNITKFLNPSDRRTQIF